MTGPTVFRGHRVTVAPLASSGDFNVGFQLQLMSGLRDVRLLLQDGTLRVTASGTRVSTERGGDLEIPPAYGR